MIEIQGNN
uniref:Uncharacterized protein n=1 Tax=Rhizophora mucronata TaxID=61149 RepID=A0A2P2NF83_RHIMU